MFLELFGSCLSATRICQFLATFSYRRYFFSKFDLISDNLFNYLLRIYDFIKQLSIKNFV